MNAVDLHFPHSFNTQFYGIVPSSTSYKLSHFSLYLNQIFVWIPFFPLAYLSPTHLILLYLLVLIVYMLRGANFVKLFIMHCCLASHGLYLLHLNVFLSTQTSSIDVFPLMWKPRFYMLHGKGRQHFNLSILSFEIISRKTGYCELTGDITEFNLFLFLALSFIYPLLHQFLWNFYGFLALLCYIDSVLWFGFSSIPVMKRLKSKSHEHGKA